MSNVQNYEYLPLEDPADCIRLLKLVSPAASSDHGNCLWGELATYRRHEAPDYRPVSYTWGQQHASSILYLKEGDANCNRHNPGMAMQTSRNTVLLSSQDTSTCSLLASPSMESDSNSSEDKHTIWRKFSIRPNLEALLRMLSELPSTLFWVDAICINQNDNHEKGYQVRNMDKVYRDKELLIWLGEPTDNSDIAINLIQAVQRFHDEFPQSSTEDSGGILLNSSSSPAAIQAFSSILQADMSNWKAFHDLIRRPWFTRRWIVQEFVLSKNKDVYIGHRIFSFDYIMGLIFLIHQFPNSLHLSSEEHEDNTCPYLIDRSSRHRFPAPTLDPVDNIDRLWEAYQASQKGETDALTLEKLLDKFASFQSYDPRDGIYAFLSMASDMDGLGVNWIPDYSDSNTVTNLYSQAVLHIIRSSHSLDIICHRIHNFEFSETVSHLSRWVPWFGPQELDRHGHSHTIHGYNTKSLTTFGQPLRTLREGQAGYHASESCQQCHSRHGSKICDECDLSIEGTGFKCLNCLDFDYCYRCISKSTLASRHDTTHQFEIHNKAVYFASSYLTVKMEDSNQSFQRLRTSIGDLPLLHSRGYLVDSIQGVGQPGMIFRNASGANFQLPLGEWLDLPGMKEIGLNNNGELRYSFFRALTGNRKIVDGRVCHIPESDLDILQQKLKPDTCAEFGEQSQPWKNLSNSIFFMLSNTRRFATTEKSLGFVPDGTVVGDRIAILVGCSVPVVICEMPITESHSVWVVKGECYIDGFMEGEMWETVGNRKHSLQTITLV